VINWFLQDEATICVIRPKYATRRLCPPDHAFPFVAIDIGLLRKAKKQIEVLCQHLADIEETEDEMGAVMLHLQGLEKILSGARKPVAPSFFFPLKDRPLQHGCYV